MSCAEGRWRVAIAALQPAYLPYEVIHLPLLWGYLRACVEQQPELASAYAFQPPIWRIESLETMLDKVGAPDVLGLSCFVWNQRNVHRFAQAVKQRHPHCLVVYGGPNVPNRPSRLLADHPWIDVCVHGEGERPFADLLRELLCPEPDWERVPGISYRRGGEQRFTAPSPRLERLDFPSPYLQGYFDPVVEGIRAERPHAAIIAGLETNRGCPFSCAFCDWGMATMSRVRHFPRGRIYDELDWVVRQKLQVVWMHDANFGLFPQDVEITRRVAQLKARTGFPAVFYPLGFAKNSKERTFEITRIIVDDGLDPHTDSVNFSLQTMSEGALRAVGRENVSLAGYRELADRYARSGYKLHPDLILPLPGETLESFKAGYSELCSWPQVSRIQVYAAALLPNSPMADPAYVAEWQLRTRRSSLGLAADPEADILDEEIDAIVSTRSMDEAEHVQAKVFVALVRALELRRLTREIRRYVCQRRQLPVWRFYDALAGWQREHDGLLAHTLERIEQAVASRLSADELVWPWVVSARDGSVLYYHKAIALDVLSEPARFLGELRALLAEAWGFLACEELEELLRYQTDQWVPPGFDPSDPQARRFEYRWDWPSHLESGGELPLARDPVRVEYHPPSDWTLYNYQRSPEAWRRLVLLEHMAYDDHLCFGAQARDLSRPGAAPGAPGEPAEAQSLDRQ